MVEVPITPNISNAPVNAGSYAGVAAPQTQGQRADVAATRVVKSEGAAEGNIRQYSDNKTIDAIKYRATMVAGDNPYLNDISFTVYAAGSAPVPGSEFVIRFTNVDTGDIEVKSAPELFVGSGGGEIISGNV